MGQIEQAFVKTMRHQRKAKALTQKELAKRLGYSEKTIAKWESGRVLPPTAALIKLAETLQFSLDELLDFQKEPQYFLGIDGGATKTDFALCDQQGTILRQIKLGSTNPVDVGIDTATKTLDEGIRKVCQSIPFRKISLFAGLAGGASANEQLRPFFESYHFGRCACGSDAELIRAAGLCGQDGIAIVMGTGSISFAQKNGEFVRIGGYGYLFDNGGSGYNIGRDVLRAVLAAEHGLEEPTLLSDLMKEHTGHRSFTPFIADFYALGKRGVAALAPIAFAAAEQKDAVAQKILSRNMKEIARLIIAGSNRMALHGNVTVVFVGGLTKQSKVLMPEIRKHLAHENPNHPNYNFYIYDKPLVYGALLLAGAPMPEGGLTSC